MLVCATATAPSPSHSTLTLFVAHRWQGAFADGAELKGLVASANCGACFLASRMLTEQLRDLADNGVLIRKAFAEIPPHVEYELSQAGIDLMPTFSALRDWSLKYEHQLKA